MSLLKKLPVVPKNKTGWPWTVETSPKIYDTKKYWPKISIVTPSFNQGSFIEETIRSILLQNYPNLELIIIDGGSTDQTLKIIKEYEPYLSYWISEKDEGQSHAINKGIAKSTGEIFNWVNSDDILLDKALFIVAQKSLKSPYDICCFSTKTFQGEEIVGVYGATVVFPELYKTLALPHLNQLGMFWRLKVVKSLGGVNQKYNYVMDLALWIKYLCIFSTTNVSVESKEESIGGFRFHNKSKTILEEKNALFSSGFHQEYDSIYSGILKGEHPDFPFKQEDLLLKRKKIYASYKHKVAIKLYYNNEKVKSFTTFMKVNPFLLDKKEIRDMLYLLRKAFFDLWK